MIDFLIQFFGAVPLLIGLWLMGNNRRLGVLLCFLAEGFTTVIGITHHVWSIIVIGVWLFVIQGRNLRKWTKEGVRW